MIVPNRRSFLAGLVSACAAPAIITPAGFRAGLFLPRCHERWLAMYDTAFDRFVVRADFAKHELAMPIGVHAIPRHLVERIKEALPSTVDVCLEGVLRPGFQQHSFDWHIAAMRAGDMHETSIEASIERGLGIFVAAPGLGVTRLAPLLQEAPSVRRRIGAAGAERRESDDDVRPGGARGEAWRKRHDQ